MTDVYDVTIERTGRIWRRLVLTRKTPGMWISTECGHWSVLGGRWASSKARRVTRRAVRRAVSLDPYRRPRDVVNADGSVTHYSSDAERDAGWAGVYTLPPGSSVPPPPPPPSGARP